MTSVAGSIAIVPLRGFDAVSGVDDGASSPVGPGAETGFSWTVDEGSAEAWDVSGAAAGESVASWGSLFTFAISGEADAAASDAEVIGSCVEIKPALLAFCDSALNSFEASRLVISMGLRVCESGR